MTDEIKPKAEDGDKLNETETKESKEKPRVSFNRDVHVKRFGKPRESRGTSETPSVRKEPFTHLTEQELINEANKVIAATKSVSCTADNPPEKFFSLPHRRKFKDTARIINDDSAIDSKTSLGRSTSDVSPRKRRERTSLSTLFRRAHRNKSPAEPVVVTTKPVAVVKRSKSDVTDLKSNAKISTQTKPIRKRSGSETEEFLKSLRNKKTQLSPIIESSPREDYFKETPPLEVFQKQKLVKKENDKIVTQKTTKDNKKVNPVEKPPRFKTPDKPEPKPPARTKRSKSKEPSPPITETPKRKTDIKKTLLVDEIDSAKVENTVEHSPIDVKDKIKDSIRKIEENVYASKDMIHSSQQPPDKPPLTRGSTVGHIVRILKEDHLSPVSKSRILSNGNSINQPFSYTKPSLSPDPNLFIRNTSPERVPSPVNKMKTKRYTDVSREDENSNPRFIKQTLHQKFSPPREKYADFTDEDEGYEEKHKVSGTRMYDYDYKSKTTESYNPQSYKITDSPIKPKFREYKLRSFEEFEPIYANEDSTIKDEPHDIIDKFRGRADGMDTKRKHYETEHNKVDLDFNELSHRRQLLESRLNARRLDRERTNIEQPLTRYLEPDPVFDAEKRMKATERFVNETVRYCRNTIERDGIAESSITEDYSKYDSDNHKVKYNTETRTFQKVPKGELDRREFINRLSTRHKNNKKGFPPEPEYEPPSLESNISKPVLSPDEYKEKKYKAKKNLTSSHDTLQTGHKYKTKDEWIGKRKGHYSSNPEIAQEREEEYANLPSFSESFHNSLRRGKNKDRYKEDFGIRRHNSGDSGEYYRDDRSPRRFDIDNRLVDSGIENDFRKESSGELHRRHRRTESDDDAHNTSLFLDSERRHTEDNYASEQIYANSDHLARFKDYKDDRYRKEYIGRERSAQDGSRFNSKTERYDKSPSRLDDKVSAKPPKAAKKLSGLEKMKQLFSRDSSKKSKKEKEPVQPKTRTRVLKSPEHLANDDSDYRRYTDPEPSEIIVKKIDYDCKADEKRFRSSREDLDRHRRDDLDIHRREELDRQESHRRDNLDRHRQDIDRHRKEDLNGHRRVDLNTHRRDELDRHTKEDLNRHRKEDINGHRRDDLDTRRRENREIHRKDDVERYLRQDLDVNRREDLDSYRREDRERQRREDSDTHRREDRDRHIREDVERHRSSDPRDSDVDRKYWDNRNDGRYNRTLNEERRYKERKEEKRRYNSSERESDQHSRPSDGESDLRKSRPRNSGTLDSPALAERYRERRRLATPSPTPSPPRRQVPPPVGAGNWFKSLDRLARKKGKPNKADKDSVITTEDESNRKNWTKSTKNLNSPAKNLRFFGDTDPDSDTKENPVKYKSQSSTKHGTLRKTISSSSTGLDEIDHSQLSSKSYSLSNLHREERESPHPKQYYKRNLQNISEIQSNSETESQFDRKNDTKPPLPYDRSRSHSSSKTLKAGKAEFRRRTEERGSSSDLRSSSKQERTQDIKARRRTPVANSNESSTEGDSSHQSQRSVVYLHATTVGDIPDPGRMTRNRSRDDVSSINSSNLQVRSTTKSFSIFAPWTPKHYNDQYDVHYDQKPKKSKQKESIKSSKLDEKPSLQKNKSYSQTTLAKRPQNTRLTNSNTSLYKKPEKRREMQSTLRKSNGRDKTSQSTEVIGRESDRERVSRSISMPKDKDKKAGWFKLSSKNKKPEVNSRVR